MRIGRCYWLWLAVAAWSSLAVAVRGQTHHYEPIDIPGDPEKVLRERLVQAQKFEELIKQIKGTRLPVDKRGFEKWILEHKETVEHFQARIGEKDAMSAKFVKELAKKWVEEKKTAVSLAKNENPKTSAPAPLRPQVKQPPAEEPPADLQERFNRWALDFLKDAEHSEVGDMIQHSPAWKTAITELKDFMNSRGVQKGFWADQLNKLSLPKALDLPAVEKTWNKIRGLKLPSLPAVGLKLPRVRASGAVSRVSLPRAWTAGQAALWIVVAICVLLIVWQLRKRGASRRGRADGWRPGPWPVDPARVASQAELIAAFEYLSLLLLGPRIRTWNHRAIAEELGSAGATASAERQQAVHTLAELYEQARYAPGEALLSAEALDTARRDLCLLAGEALP